MAMADDEPKETGSRDVDNAKGIFRCSAPISFTVPSSVNTFFSRCWDFVYWSTSKIDTKLSTQPSRSIGPATLSFLALGVLRKGSVVTDQGVRPKWI